MKSKNTYYLNFKNLLYQTKMLYRNKYQLFLSHLNFHHLISLLTGTYYHLFLIIYKLKLRIYE